MKTARLPVIALLVTMLAGLAPVLAEVPESVELFPVQHHGRVKPLDTFARIHLLAFSGKRTVGDVTPTQWLLDVLTSPDGESPHRVFKVRNPEVLAALSLAAREDKSYTFKEVAQAVSGQQEMLRQIQEKPEEARSPVDSQLLELYRNLVNHQEISLSASCLLPLFRVSDPGLASALGLEPGQSVSYRKMLSFSPKLNELLTALGTKDKQTWDAADQEVFRLADQLNRVQGDRFATNFSILPAASGQAKDPWTAPWAVIGDRDLGPKQRAILDGWEALLAAHNNGISSSAATAADSIAEVIATGPSGELGSRLKLEAWYNGFDLFYKSVAFYILGFLLVSIGFLFKPGWLRKIAFGSMALGLVLHLAGLLARMVIMGRAPVSNLYESVIFVGAVAVVSGLILEWMRKDGMGILLGVIAGAVLHFVGFGQAAEGDTMGMLVAVLDSNFWLATHVVTITIGYGCSLIAGLAGHLYLVFHAFFPGNKQRLEVLTRNMMGLTLVALFFTLFGTILGGIWADQSWGRFWGWDPKENGALLIVMWQLMLLHGVHSKIFRSPGFAFGLVINNIVVALAWFGVNLLNVGLHSYGFTDSMAMNLSIFCGAELLIGLVLYMVARQRKVATT